MSDQQEKPPAMEKPADKLNTRRVTAFLLLQRLRWTGSGAENEQEAPDENDIEAQEMPTGPISTEKNKQILYEGQSSNSRSHSSFRRVDYRQQISKSLKVITATKDSQESIRQKFLKNQKSIGRAVKLTLDKQEMAKHTTSLALTIAMTILIVYQRDPKAMSRIMQVIVSLLSVGFVALLFGILFRKKFKSFAFRSTLLGLLLTLGALFVFFTYLLWPHSTAYITITSFLIIFLVLVMAFFHG
ncbi:hypothetical protein TIFTF001_044566 [Ficus carica]|uniref:Uncharacterized protein n=1 Tax=Ficus carica TaxID=3494 RepID=A0AA87ZC75_FICCA|nr:hypothetical protein TIFTF001_044566 [Ficus carica]